jgi:hypothetical protein
LALQVETNSSEGLCTGQRQPRFASYSSVNHSL